MGLGPPILALYTQLKQLGVLDGVTEVMELGAQNVWSGYQKFGIGGDIGEQRNGLAECRRPAQHRPLAIRGLRQACPEAVVRIEEAHRLAATR